MALTLNSVQLPLFSAPLRSQEPPAPQPPPQEPPPQPDPEPGIDFSKIDCPYTAALLPTLNPASLATVFTGLIASSMTGAPAFAALALTFNNTQGALNYSFDPNDPNALVKGTGTLGEAAYTETWSVNQETGAIVVSGSIGESSQELTLTENPEDGSMLISGHVGELAVSTRIFTVNSEKGDDSRSRLIVDGTLGGRPYHQEISLAGESEQGSALVASGYLNGSDLNQTVLMSGTDSGQSTLATGDIGGVAFTLNANLALAQP